MGKGISIDVNFTDHSAEILRAMNDQVKNIALQAIGQKAEDYAKDNSPVDTGRLRNSITNAVEMGEQAVYIGTNVEYAGYVELGTSRMKPRPYLKPAVVNYMSEYKTLAEQAFRG